MTNYKRILFCILVMLCVEVGIFSQVLSLKAIKYYETCYAEWGVKENGQDYEDRYDGMEFAISKDGSVIGSVICYQHWFGKNRTPYPKIGDSILVKEFDFKIRELPLDEYTIAFNELEIID